jgi:hypothetical protein
MNPFTYADGLVKFQGSAEAIRIAQATRKTIEIAMMDPAHSGTPFADEVDIKEHTIVSEGKLTTRTVTIVDEARKAGRMKKTLIFWQNVTNYLAKKFPAQA